MVTPPTESARRRRVEELFLLAAELDPAERAAFLERHCHGDTALRSELEELLLQDERGTADWLAAAQVTAGIGTETTTGGEEIEEDAWLPERVGRYRLLERIGEGGMGSVWLAEQERPVQRRVALKFLKGGRAGRRQLERFEGERQALARMEHPGIARIYDAGATEGGRPWFAMEHVDGEPIDAYCDRRKLGLHDRLELFVAVCDAVGHAHRKGVLHRDLKPSNVLVARRDGRAEPKLIDFGIARVLGAEGFERDLVGSWHFLSPEQIESRGRDLDTRSDVYALGGLLQQLLMGLPPFEEPVGPRDEAALERRLAERPLAPSVRLAAQSPEQRTAVAAARSTTPRALARALRGDLDWIVARALARDREHRFPTVDELAADVRRHLDGFPVSAAPMTIGYVTGKSLQRNRFAYGALGAIGALLVLAVLGTTRGLLLASEARRAAEAEALEAREVGAFLAKTLGLADPFSELSGAETIQDLLARASEELDSSFTEGSHSYATAARALGRAFHSLGDLDRAYTLLSSAVDAHDRLDDVPLDERYAALRELILVCADSDVVEAYELRQRSSGLAIELLAASGPPAVAEAFEHAERPSSREAFETPLADRYAELAAAADRWLGRDDPLRAVVADEVAFRGFTRHTLEGRPDGAELLEFACELREGDDGRGAGELARTRMWLAEASLFVDRPEQAAEQAALAQEVFQRVLPEGHWLTQRALSVRGECLMRLGAVEQACPMLERSWLALEAIRGEDSRATLEALRRRVALLDYDQDILGAAQVREKLRTAFARTRNAPLLWRHQRVAFGDERPALLAATDALSGIFEGMEPNRPTEEQIERLTAATECVATELTGATELDVIVARQLATWSLIVPLRHAELQIALNARPLEVLLEYGRAPAISIADAHVALGVAARRLERPAEAVDHLALACEQFDAVLGELAFSTLLARVEFGHALAALDRVDAARAQFVAVERLAGQAFGEEARLARRAKRALARIDAGEPTTGRPEGRPGD